MGGNKPERSGWNNLSVNPGIWGFEFLHYISPAELNVTPDIANNNKSTASVSPVVKSALQSSSLDLVVHPAPPVCLRVVNGTFSHPLITNSELSGTFKKGAICVVDFYVEGYRKGNAVTLNYRPRTFVVVGQSDNGRVVRRITLPDTHGY